MDETIAVGRRRLSAEEWARHLAEQAKSCEGVKAYCARNGLTTQTFYHWRARLGDGGDPQRAGSFVECCLSNGTGGSGLVLEHGDFRLLVGAGFDEATLKRVLGVLTQC